MLRPHPILVSAPWRLLALGAIAVTLLGCGQKGDLYLPSTPAAANRATLPETIQPAGILVPTPMPAASAPTVPR